MHPVCIMFYTAVWYKYKANKQMLKSDMIDETPLDETLRTKYLIYWIETSKEA